MEYGLLVAGAVICATLAIRATRLLTSALWLAGVSALTAIVLFAMGAREIAVIELSVGAGLVTVLFVFAIGIAGNDTVESRPLIPRPLAWSLVALAFLLLIFTIMPPTDQPAASAEAPFVTILWENRALDVLVQIVLIFSGVLGILGLLAEPKTQGVPPIRLFERENHGVSSTIQPAAPEHEPEKELQ